MPWSVLHQSGWVITQCLDHQASCLLINPHTVTVGCITCSPAAIHSKISEWHSPLLLRRPDVWRRHGLLDKTVFYLRDSWQPSTWWSNRATNNSVIGILESSQEDIYIQRLWPSVLPRYVNTKTGILFPLLSFPFFPLSLGLFRVMPEMTVHHLGIKRCRCWGELSLLSQDPPTHTPALGGSKLFCFALLLLSFQ